MCLQGVEFTLLLAVPDVGDELLGGERQVALDHPVVVGRLLLEDFLDGLAFVLAEVEHFAMLGVVAYITLDFSPLPSGTYILRIATPAGTAVKKLVVAE